MKYFYIMAVALTLSSCSSFDEKILYDYHNVLSEDSKEMLLKSTSACGFGAGYDCKYQSDFIFFTKGNSTNATEKDMASVLDKYSEKEIEYLFLQAHRINESVVYLHKHYKRLKNWREYYYLNNDILLASNMYFNLVSSYYSSKYPAAFSSIAGKKELISRNAVLFYQEKEAITDSYK